MWTTYKVHEFILRSLTFANTNLSCDNLANLSRVSESERVSVSRCVDVLRWRRSSAEDLQRGNPAARDCR